MADALPPRRWPKYLGPAVSLATLAAVFVVAELLFRIFWKAPTPRLVVEGGTTRVWCCGPEVLVDGVERFAPNATFKHCYDEDRSGSLEPDHCVTYRINSLGFRDVEHAIEKPDGVYRIVLLGDSFTMGEGTVDDAIYPTLLARDLTGRTIGGKRVEVINLGFPGNDTSLEHKEYRLLARRLRPDWVITQWTTNDFPASNAGRARAFEVGKEYIDVLRRIEKPWPSRVYEYAWLKRRMGAISAALVEATNADLRRGSPNFGQIRALRDLVSQDGARFTLLVFPELVQFQRYPFAELQSALLAYCKSARIDAVDLLPELSKHVDRDLWVHEIDHHPNRVAHRIAYEELAKAIQPSLDR